MPKVQKTKKAPNRQPRRKQQYTFGPVSAINSAPVAIGNSIRGTRAKVVQVRDGVRVIGRDFCFQAAATVAAATGWECVVGFPLTPSCLPSSILRNYCQMYAKFKINNAMVHYITSSATSQTGDVLFYNERDRKAPMVDYTNNSFLPYVLSDANTVLGPQWMNHSIEVVPSDDYNFTDYGMNADLNLDTAGSVFLFSKTSSASSPGYVIWDYDITFKELSVNPRAGLLPVARAQWSSICIGKTTVAVTAGSTTVAPVIQGNTIGGVAAAAPNGAVVGDIYKVIFQVTDSTVSGTNAAWTNVTAATLMAYHTAGGISTAVVVDDGFTCYAVYSNTAMWLYPTLEDAMTDTNPFYYGVTATITYNLCALVSLVGSVASFTQSSY